MVRLGSRLGGPAGLILVLIREALGVLRRARVFACRIGHGPTLRSAWSAPEGVDTAWRLRYLHAPTAWNCGLSPPNRRRQAPPWARRPMRKSECAQEASGTAPVSVTRQQKE